MRGKPQPKAAAPARALHAPQEDELNIINVLSRQLLHEAAEVEDLSEAVSVSLHGRNIVKLESLELCNNLRVLDLSFNLLKRLDGIECLTKLKELRAYDNHITALSAITTLTQLHTLDVSGNKLTSLQGVAALRGLRVLRCAHNPHLTSLEGLGRAGAIESLDVSYCGLPDLSSLTAAVALTELVCDGNRLTNFKGLQRCDRLCDLSAAHNQLTSLQGLKACAGTLDTLDVRDNKLRSLDTLTEGLTRLHELYVSDNQLTSLVGLPAKAPALETLDVSSNALDWREGGCPQLIPDLCQLPELSWVSLANNPGCPPGYQVALLSGLPALDGVDDLPRPQLPSGADVWVNTDTEGTSQDVVSLLTGPVEPSQLLPTHEEIEQYKTHMGIRTQLPAMGIQTNKGRQVRPPSASRPPSQGGPTHTRPHSAMGVRPGSARPGTAGGAGGGVVKDSLMYARVPSARTGAGARLMTPDQYATAISEFKDVMDDYSNNLRSVLSTMKAGLQLSISEQAQQVRTPEGQAARQLPTMPVVPAMPQEMIRDRVLPAATAQQDPAATAATAAAAGTPAGTSQEALVVRREALRDPGAPAALELYARLYPQPAQPPRRHGSGSSRPGSAAGPAATAAGRVSTSGNHHTSTLTSPPSTPPTSQQQAQGASQQQQQQQQQRHTGSSQARSLLHSTIPAKHGTGTATGDDDRYEIIRDPEDDSGRNSDSHSGSHSNSDGEYGEAIVCSHDSDTDVPGSTLRDAATRVTRDTALQPGPAVANLASTSASAGDSAASASQGSAQGQGPGDVRIAAQASSAGRIEKGLGAPVLARRGSLQRAVSQQDGGRAVDRSSNSGVGAQGASPQGTGSPGTGTAAGARAVGRALSFGRGAGGVSAAGAVQGTAEAGKVAANVGVSVGAPAVTKVPAAAARRHTLKARLPSGQ